MARPHIEFVQAQHLPWQKGPRDGVDCKLLSRDAATGALSAIFRYPPGWQAPAETLDWDEEFFVLDGRLDHGGTAYGADCYAFWPRGFARRPLSAPGGATVLTFFAARDPRPYDPARLVERTDLRQGAWTANLEAMGLAKMATTSRIREMRSDPATGEITYITAVIPYFQEDQSERHPVVQEIFVLAGEVAGPQGVMRAGAYVWRPENKTHGPYGSTTGAVFFFRSHGGPQSTEWDPPSPHDFDPAHAPVLPPELAAHGQPVARPTRY
jgi:hypothetical protein